MSEFDPIWIVYVLRQWQPCGCVMLKDLRRWIVVGYLLDPITIYQCWRAVSGSSTTLPNRVDTWWRIRYGYWFDRTHLCWDHIPILAQMGKVDDILITCKQRGFAAMVASAHQLIASPDYDGLLMRNAEIVKYAYGNWYMPTAEERDWLVKNGNCDCAWGWPLLSQFHNLDCDFHAIPLRQGAVYMTAVYTTPWFAKQESLSGRVLDRVHGESSYNNYLMYRDCLDWYKIDPLTRGQLLIAELCLAQASSRRLIYTRSGVDIRVRVWDLMKCDRKHYNDVIIGLYVAGVKFIL